MIYHHLLVFKTLHCGPVRKHMMGTGKAAPPYLEHQHTDTQPSIVELGREIIQQNKRQCHHHEDYLERSFTAP